MTDTTIYSLTDLVLDQLRTVVGLAVFDAQVPDTPPKDDAGIVKPYAIVYPSPGMRTASRYDELPDTLAWLVQVTCAAGSPRGARVAIDWACGVLIGWAPYPDDRAVGFLTQVNDPGPLQRSETPANDLRWWSPIQLTLTI